MILGVKKRLNELNPNTESAGPPEQLDRAAAARHQLRKHPAQLRL